MINEKNIKVLVENHSLETLREMQDKNSLLIERAYVLWPGVELERLQDEANELMAAVDIVAFGE